MEQCSWREDVIEDTAYRLAKLGCVFKRVLIWVSKEEDDGLDTFVDEAEVKDRIELQDIEVGDKRHVLFDIVPA